MRALALKLAAVGTGAALAAGAATAQASTTAAGGALGGVAGGGLAAVKTGGALTLSKLAVSIALVGAAATGAVMLPRSGAPQPSTAASHETAVVPQAQPGERPSQPMSTSLGAPVQPTTAPNTVVQNVGVPGVRDEAVARVAPPAKAPAEVTTRELTADTVTAELPASQDEQGTSKAGRTGRVERHVGRGAQAPVAEKGAAHVDHVNPAAGAKPVSVERVAGGRQQLSEIDLLRGARAALAARPREAYRLTEEHKGLYPQGVFAQERDALAVEAVQRAGDLKLARRLAEAFVKSYPSSPHAHRFRETMGLQ